jgi:DNA helicase-2/ATP-dependent DNA helicase PcrA
VTKCFYDKINYPEYRILKAYRKDLLQNNKSIKITDFGAGSKVFSSENRKISAIAKNVGIPKKRARFLFRLVNYLKCENILELENAISYFQKSNKNPNLSSFLQEITLITDSDKYDEDKPAVTLMTVHGSKGLEFPVVFSVGLEEDLFPMGGRNGDEANIEEERRLFYVAITRAQNQLFFSYCRSRYKYGEEKTMMRSRFLDEVSSDVVRTETGSTINQKNDRFSTNDGDASSDSDTTVEYDWKQPLYNKNNRNADDDTTVHYDNPDEDPFQVGAKVEHNVFGKGKIINRSGTDEKTKVVIFFKGRGRKTLMLRVAKLRVVG